MWKADQWKDYEVLDTSDGEKLERWGSFYLVRPDPQVIWSTPRQDPRWKRFDARYARSSTGGGHWSAHHLPEHWCIRYRELTFQVKPMNFKHTGVFPEQAANWDFIDDQIRRAGRPVSVLNLFAYTGGGNPHCHIMLTMRPLDERGAWAAKSKKEYDLDENGERIRLPSGRYKTHKVDLTGWNDKGNALLWRKAWADISNAYLEHAGRPERIDHRSNAERGIDELPTVHMGVAACQMEKKGIATEKGELNRNIQKANRLIREIRAQIGKLKEWIGELFKARETAPEQPPQSPGLANLLIKYMSVQREKSRKYSQYWQRQHAADELKTVSQAVNFLAERGISTLAELDAALSSVSEQADAIREGMKTAEKRMKELQKLIEYGRNYTEYKPIHDELKKLKNGWTNKRDKYEEAHRAELTLWNAASRYLHANLPKGTKPPLPISEWEKEYATLSGQRTAEYTKLKETRAEVAGLQNIRKCVDIALKADQPEQTRAKRHDLER